MFEKHQKKLPFPFYEIVIHVPYGWEVREAMYPNRIDLYSGLGHIKIWFKDLTDNDQFIINKEERQQSYEQRIRSGKANITNTQVPATYQLNRNVVYLEYIDLENNGDNVCNWFSMVYDTREIQIALARGNIKNDKTRSDFEKLIEKVELFVIL